jgi:hypothetical protein
LKALEDRLGIRNPDWLMSTREKLCLIGMLELLKAKRTLEFGYHRGGATNWLSKYSEEVITVDVNVYVHEAEKLYPNITSWNIPTQEAVARINRDKQTFDLAIIDADHSREAIANDLKGLIDHAEIILMHDSSNPSCRKGMLDALKHQDSHAYNLDFVTSSIKHDGLWGGLGVAIRSENPGRMKEFNGEFSPYNYLYLHHSLSLANKCTAGAEKLKTHLMRTINRIKVKVGGALAKLR